MAEKPDYGIDAPEAFRNVTVGGLLVLAAGGALLWWGWQWPAIIVLAIGALTITCAAYWLFSTKYGKVVEWNHLLDGLALRGDERVLDAGCGRGLLVVGAAKRLSTGMAVGVDIWANDQSGNSASATIANTRAEAVLDRAQVTTGDLRDLPFGDGRFDVAVSNLVLDNIKDEGERAQAVREIARVVKPGGRVVIADLASEQLYADTLRGEGWNDVQRSAPHFLIFPPVRVVKGIKPLS